MELEVPVLLLSGLSTQKRDWGSRSIAATEQVSGPSWVTQLDLVSKPRVKERAENGSVVDACLAD